MNNQSIMDRDLSVLWHPCTQMKDHERMPLIPIKSGKGAWLHDFEDNRYLDAISSWWVNLFGHANPHINAALKGQMESLEHVLLAGFTHEPAVALAEKLVSISPAGLSKCFFADNGSSAVEVSMKMSFHYWRNQGHKNKTRFITLSNSYHGETLGALAVGNVSLYKETYAPLLMDVITVTSPDAFNKLDSETDADYARRTFAEMETTLAKYADETCAVIIEPLVQCGGNMRMYDPIYLKLLKAACEHYNVHLIADEIAVGFGRTGTLFACEQGNITPDFMCLSKGLTGGYLPLSAVLTNNQVYDAFYDDYDTLKAFLHSHSYTGNALACRAALATLEIFEQDQVIKNNLSLSQLMGTLCKPLSDHSHIADIRQHGMILAIEMVQDKQNKIAYPWQQRRGLSVYQHGLKNSVLLRPLGNVVYFMPPYVITEAEIKKMINVAAEGIDIATQTP